MRPGYMDRMGMHSRKYAIRKIQPKASLNPKPRKRKGETYDGQVKVALAKVWEIFDCPCGQRPMPLLEGEADRLREFGELNIPDDAALKLKRIGICEYLKRY
jgi:hypothetical protein